MLGMGDFYVELAYAANIVVVAVCVIYGIKNWNTGDDAEIVAKKKGKHKNG